VSDGQALASRAADVAGQLTRHLARLVGDVGVRALFRRSVVLASVAFPWLARSRPSAGADAASAPPHAPLCEAMAGQPEPVALEAFVAVLGIFVSLLGRLIGEPLIRRLIHEIWPAQFGSDKESV
jgi:hypothetical protein